MRLAYPAKKGGETIVKRKKNDFEFREKHFGCISNKVICRYKRQINTHTTVCSKARMLLVSILFL
jgi:hypothetical protein